MFKFLKTFRADQNGAVTVDWVVLTAAVVGLGVAAVATVSDGIDTATNTLVNDLIADTDTATTTN